MSNSSAEGQAGRMESVGLVGTGLIGRGWAVVFARAGYRVRLWDAAPRAADTAMMAIRRSLDDLQEIGLVDSADVLYGQMAPAETLAQAVGDAVYVQESAPENADIKRAVHTDIDASAPAGAVIGSSCSAIPGSVFMDALPGRHRCLIAHPANPPHLMPVVELVPTPWTDPAAVATCRCVMEAGGQVPVLLNHEVPGFVMNRLQAAVVNEAMHLVTAGVMSPEDVDKTMRYSLGMRWSFMGPFETMELNAPDGFADYAARYGGSYEAMGRDLHVADPWTPAAVAAIEESRRRLLPKDGIGERQTWRDRRLMALLKILENSTGSSEDQGAPHDRIDP